jgi:hypothetical protein
MQYVKWAGLQTKDQYWNNTAAINLTQAHINKVILQMIPAAMGRSSCGVTWACCCWVDTPHLRSPAPWHFASDLRC